MSRLGIRTSPNKFVLKTAGQRKYNLTGKLFLLESSRKYPCTHFLIHRGIGISLVCYSNLIPYVLFLKRGLVIIMRSNTISFLRPSPFSAWKQWKIQWDHVGKTAGLLEVFIFRK